MKKKLKGLRNKAEDEKGNKKKTPQEKAPQEKAQKSFAAALNSVQKRKKTGENEIWNKFQ